MGGGGWGVVVVSFWLVGFGLLVCLLVCLFICFPLTYRFGCCELLDAAGFPSLLTGFSNQLLSALQRAARRAGRGHGSFPALASCWLLAQCFSPRGSAASPQGMQCLKTAGERLQPEKSHRTDLAQGNPTSREHGGKVRIR